MSGNVIKSDAGWVRLRARVNAPEFKGRQAVRSAQMDYSVPKAKPVKIEESEGEQAIVVNGRRRRRAFVAHNGRY